MYPEIMIFGRSLPTYWLCALFGLLVCIFVAIPRMKLFRDLSGIDISNMTAFILIGVVIGGRLLSALTMIPLIIRNWDTLSQNKNLIYELLSNGMVFYGGLFGAALAVYFYSARNAMDQKSVFDFFAPLFPLFHAFGRIGCFLTGCCHGIVSERLGIAFSHSRSSLNGVPYFPIQLAGSLLEFLMFFLLTAYEKRHHKEGRSFRLYLLCYAAGRFILEYFRGDEIRGLFFGLSTSQWISLGILAVFAVKLINGLMKQRKNQKDMV